MTKHIIRIIGLVNGQRSPYDNQYVSRFDFDGCGPGEANLKTTPLPQNAMQFDSAVDAWDFWKTVDPRQPLRPDGQPNRPMTAFTVSIDPVGK